MRKSKVQALSLRDAMDEVVAEKGIDLNTLQEAIQESVAEAFRRHFEVDIPVRTELREGRFRIYGGKTVVETVENTLTEIAQKDARAKGYGLGATIEVEITPAELGEQAEADLTAKFGLIAAQCAKQVVRQRLREAERRIIYEEFKGREGEMVHGKVQRVRHGSLIVELGRTEAILPRRELPPREKYKEGDRVKAVIMEVRLGPKGPQIVLSRAHPWLVENLFKMEISEVFDKTVEIKAIAREAGFRTKVAVASRDANVDPVGACVGQKGIRVQTVVRELGGEKIDIVHWDPEPTVFIRNALSPAECERVIIHEGTRTAEIIVRDEHQSLAIGKEGQNARLAAKLTGWKIEIRGAGEQPRDAIDALMSRIALGAEPTEILAFLGIGAETAPAFIAAGLDSVERIAGATEEQIAQVAPSVAEGTMEGLVTASTAVTAEMKVRLAEDPLGQRSGRRGPKARRTLEEIGPFTLPNGQVVAGASELTAALDELPGDMLESVLQSNELKTWMQDIGMPPAEISDLMGRYR